MSTKIFYAYRIPKEVDILRKLKILKNMAIDTIAKEEILLALIHSHVIYVAQDLYKEDPSNHMAKHALDCNASGKLDEFWTESVLKGESDSIHRTNLDIKLECSIFYDNDYWYVKFFPNNAIYYKFLENIKSLGFEDYHYQNQSDPPEDIPSEDYEKRSEVWDNLLESSGGNYRDGFLYIIFDAYEFKKLISKNHYTGNPLYEHLAYDFGRKIKIIT